MRLDNSQPAGWDVVISLSLSGWLGRCKLSLSLSLAAILRQRLTVIGALSQHALHHPQAHRVVCRHPDPELRARSQRWEPCRASFAATGLLTGCLGLTVGKQDPALGRQPSIRPCAGCAASAVARRLLLAHPGLQRAPRPGLRSSWLLARGAAHQASCRLCGWKQCPLCCSASR